MSQTIFWNLIDETAIRGEEKDFLSPEELAVANTMRFPKRRQEWLMGRWAAKRLLGCVWCCEARDLIIQNEPEGAPYAVFAKGGLVEGCLTISHSAKNALCGYTRNQGLAVGVDLEQIEPRSPEFIKDYFTDQEVAQIKQCPPDIQPLASTLIWSAKESALKALRKGLRLDTRSVEVGLGDLMGVGVSSSWQPITIDAKGWTWRSWFRADQVVAYTMAATGAVDPMEFISIEQLE